MSGYRIDPVIPLRLREGPAEAYRRARLVTYATLFAVLTALPVAAIFHSMGNAALMHKVLLGMVPSALTLAVLWVSRSAAVAGHYLTACVFAQVMVDFGPENFFSILAIFSIPIISTALISERAGAFWTLASAGWIGWVGLGTPAEATLYYGLVWSSAVVVLVLGFALVILEASRSNARAELEQVTQELATQQERLRAFADAAFPGIAHTISGRLVFVGDGVQRLLGYPTEQFMSRELLSYVHPDEATPISDRLLRQPGQGFRQEVRLRHFDGHWVWLEAYAIPFGVQAHSWLFAARDISEERRQRERWTEMQKFESVGVLAAGVAHDFNNLLTVILGFADLLERSDARDEIVTAAEEAAKLTQQLLSYARPGESAGERADAGRVLAGIMPMVRSLMGDSVTVDYQQPGERRLPVPLSDGQLHQIILNLCKNAREAMPDGGQLKLRTVRTEISDDGDLASGAYVNLTVEDTGQGMDEDVRRRAVDPFYSTKQQTRSSGLGLANVFSMVSTAGGFVAIDSQPGRGTAVTVTLPLLPSEGALRRSDELQSPGRLLPARRLGEVTVLVVDDDNSVRAFLHQALTRAGFAVALASNGAEALQACRIVTPDVLITDIVMPGTRGDRLANQLCEQLPGLHVLYISGNAAFTDGSVVATPRCRFLQKPFRTEDLLEQLADWPAPIDPADERREARSRP
ncbi:MAG: ATP-binding protein [Pseudomonadota bacterium]